MTFPTQAIEGLRQADAQTTARLGQAGIVNWRVAAPGENVRHDVLCDFTLASPELQRDVEHAWRRALREKGEGERALDCFDRIATEEGLAARFLWEAGARPRSKDQADWTAHQKRIIGENYGFFSFLVDGCAALRTLVLCPRYTGHRARIEPHLWTAKAADFYGLAINYQQYCVIEASMRYGMRLRREGKSARRHSDSVPVSAEDGAIGVTADTIRTAGVLSEIRANQIISDLLILQGDKRASYIADLRKVLNDREADDDAAAPAPSPAPPPPERRVSFQSSSSDEASSSSSSEDEAPPPRKKRRGAEPSPPRATGSPQRSMSPLKASPDALARYHDFRKRASEDGGLQYD